MKKGLKKAIASMLAVTMVLGSSIMSFAGEATTNPTTSSNTTTASANFEGHVNKSVVNVTLPTVSADNYNFIIDPEALISQTSGKRYPNAKFDTADVTGVYFASGTEDGKTVYTSKSVMPDVINKSSVSVNVTMSIEITRLNPAIKTVSESAVNTGTDANLWLAVTNGTDKAEVVGTTASMTQTIPGVSNNYVVSWNVAKGEYQYVIKDDAVDSTWQKTTLGLMGACNTNGDWSASGLSQESEVQVTWKYEAIGVVGPTVTGTAKVVPNEGVNYLALKGENNASFETTATRVIVNGKDVTADAGLLYGYVVVKASDLTKAGIQLATGLTLNATYIVDGTQYTSSYIVQ